MKNLSLETLLQQHLFISGKQRKTGSVEMAGNLRLNTEHPIFSIPLVIFFYLILLKIEAKRFVAWDNLNWLCANIKNSVCSVKGQWHFKNWIHFRRLQFGHIGKKKLHASDDSCQTRFLSDSVEKPEWSTRTCGRGCGTKLKLSTAAGNNLLSSVNV